MTPFKESREHWITDTLLGIGRLPVRLFVSLNNNYPIVYRWVFHWRILASSPLPAKRAVFSRRTLCSQHRLAGTALAGKVTKGKCWRCAKNHTYCIPSKLTIPCPTTQRGIPCSCIEVSAQLTLETERYLHPLWVWSKNAAGRSPLKNFEWQWLWRRLPKAFQEHRVPRFALWYACPALGSYSVQTYPGPQG